MISKRIRKLRMNKGLTQAQAADALNIPRVNYNRYEKGEREPDLDTIKNIANYFRVSTDMLLVTIGETTEIPLDTSAIQAAINSHNPEPANSLTAKIKSLTDKIGKADDVIQLLQEREVLEYVRNHYLP